MQGCDQLIVSHTAREVYLQEASTQNNRGRLVDTVLTAAQEAVETHDEEIHFMHSCGNKLYRYTFTAVCLGLPCRGPSLSSFSWGWRLSLALRHFWIWTLGTCR